MRQISFRFGANRDEQRSKLLKLCSSYHAIIVLSVCPPYVIVRDHVEEEFVAKMNEILSG